MPVVRTANAAFAWRYPTRIPAAQTIRSPPTPGRAKAASADSEACARNALTVCSRRESAPDGLTPSAASGAVPESDKSALKLAVAVRPSFAGAVISPNNGMAPMGDVGKTSGGKGAVGGTSAAPAAADSLELPDRVDRRCVHSGNEQRVKIRRHLREKHDRVGNRDEHVLDHRDDIGNRHCGSRKRHEHGRHRQRSISKRYDRIRHRLDHF